MTQGTVSRQDPAWYTPTDLPEEVLAFDRSVRGAPGVGAAGKVGLLDLRLAPCGGVTRVQRQYQRAPLYIYRPIYLDAGRPDMAFVFVLQSGDGLVQGDRYRVDIDCAPGAAAHITTQAATNVFAARQSFGIQLVNLRAQAGAVLEYLPGPVVPFRGSRLFQRISLTADRESTVSLGETLLPGRVAHGEAHVYDLYCSETEVCRSDGVLLFSDVFRLGSADDRHPKSIGLLGEYDVVATLYVISRRTDPIAMVAGGPRVLPRCAGRRQRTAQRLRCRRQTAWLHLEGSADGAGHGVERGTPGAARDSGAHPAQGIARSAVRTPPPPPHSQSLG